MLLAAVIQLESWMEEVHTPIMGPGLKVYKFLLLAMAYSIPLKLKMLVIRLVLFQKTGPPLIADLLLNVIFLLKLLKTVLAMPMMMFL